MEKPSAQEPLLSNFSENEKPFSFVSTSVKWVLKIAIWGLFLFWAGFLFLFPTEVAQSGFERWVGASQGTVFGLKGSIFLVFSGPILMMAFLAVVYLILFGGEEHQENNGRKNPSFRLWTFPVIVNGPFGVVSAAEFIGIIVFFAFVILAITVYTIHNLSRLPEIPLPPELRSTIMLKLSGLRLGLIGLFCLAFLFLPIARGSILLRLIDIPFEHATRYHVWLGHLTMLMFTLHGLFYIVAWIIEGRFIHEILEWKDIGVANLAGVISLIAGLFMWVTSLPPVRKQNFELFFYTHQLYIVFVVFLALHVGDFIFSMAAGGIFLFMLDRFLRFWQSRNTVDIISATCLPCGTVELVLSKPPSLRYNALSFIFLQVRELSWLQWHPFSVSSSPLDGKYHLEILIKVLGTWTEKLRDRINLGMLAQINLPCQPHSKITASVEGPYGHESPYHLTYETLILVAGGIGISPFLAILRDIFHRIEEGKPCLPQNILVVWAVKTYDELCLLSNNDMESICPFYTDKVNLDIQIFVTREEEPPLEEGKNLRNTKSSALPIASSGCAMSALVGTGDNMWSGIYVSTSIVGLIILMALLDIYYINPFKISAWWYKGLLLLMCMVASVIIFGGFVVSLWNLWEGKFPVSKSEENLKQIEGVPTDQLLASTHSWQENFESSRTIKYGRRPDFREIFESVSKSWGHVNIGVIVCGPPTLQCSVAKECRSQNLGRGTNHPIFHFNCHSFDL